VDGGVEKGRVVNLTSAFESACMIGRELAWMKQALRCDRAVSASIIDLRLCSFSDYVHTYYSIRKKGGGTQR
jgi:phosphotransacetylase